MHYIKRLTLLKYFRRKAKRYSNINKSHYFIRPILQEVPTLRERPRGVKAKTGGQKSVDQKQNKVRFKV